jgi:predicted nicotinamide N-methyase
MTLTDLPDALEIMQQNIDLVGSTTTDLQAKVLSWGPKDSIHGGNKDDTVWAGDEQLVDLILLTDVLYNQGSHDLLLETLEWLMKSRNCKVLLAYKERNTDERVFFSKIKDRHWQCVEAAPTGDHPDSKYPFEMYWIQK